MLKQIFAILTLLFSSLFTIAQDTQFTGKVSNDKNETLAGATILVVETGRQITSDADGRFVLTLEKGKKYSITISNTGYSTKTISDIELSSNADNNFIEIILNNSAKTDLTGVTVVATSRRQENTNALIAFQRNNTSLSSGLAADFIRRTPDKNTGEVLRRVSGASIQDNKFVIIRGLSDRYNSAYINGAILPSSEPDKKAFSFDVIPSSLIDNIIINKTATPDLTGEFAGGLVQIKTKDIPTSNQLIVGFSLGFNTQSVFEDFTSNTRGENDWLGFSDRSLTSAYPRRYLDYARLPTEDRLNIARSFNDRAYDEVNSTAGPIQQYNLTWANVKRFKNGSAFGSILGLTYRNSKLLFDASKVLFESNNSSRAFFNYNDEQNKYSVNVGGVANLAWTYKKNKIAFKNLFNQLLEDNYYTRTGINTENLQDVLLRSSVLNQRSLYSAQLEGTHELPVKNIKWDWNLNFSLNDKSQPDLRVQTFGKSIGVNEPYRINLRGNNTNRFYSELNDKAFGYTTSFTMPFVMGGRKQSLKVGGASTIRLRDFKAFIFGYSEPTDQSLNTVSFNEIFNNANIREGGFNLITDLQNPQDKYYGVSALSAGYLMLDNKLSEKIRLVWGTRFEYFEQFVKSNRQGTDKAQIQNTDKLDFLPSFNFTISTNKKTNIRIAGSRTVARPEFREIVDFTFFDFEQIASTSGLPGLERSSILNGDIRYEIYPKAGEVISFGAFYKNFKDAIELRLNSGSVATRRQYQFQNAESAELFGIEAEFRKSLSFLKVNEDGGWLSRLYFNGNATLIFSEVTLGNFDAAGVKLPSTNRPLQGQSPYLINAGFQYDSEKGTNISILYNRIGERLSLVGNDDFSDLYEQPRNLLDFQISQKVMKTKGEIRLTVSDIFNNPFTIYANNDDKRVFDATSDRIFSSYTPGTTITLGFNYNFDLKK